MTIINKSYFKQDGTHIFYPKFNGFRNSEKVNGYKAVSFQETIQNITKSLKFFLKRNKFVEHSSYTSSIEDIWITSTNLSHALEVGNDFILYNSFGKGTTLEASVASGYAELIERLQIGWWFSRNLLKPKICPIFNTEISKKDKELNERIFKKTRKNNPYLPNWDGYNKMYLPFKNVYTNEEVFLDTIFLSSTKGCASGNSYEEAFVQALCEIFETYTILKVISNNIKCPTIPSEYISNNNKEIIQKFNKENIDIIVKDLSLNKGIPVVGVVFHHKQIDKLEFHISAATSINFAIERCFTEKLQVFPFHKIRLRYTKRYLLRISKLYKVFPELNNYFPLEYFFKYRFEVQQMYPSKKLEFLIVNFGSFKKWDYSDENFLVELKNLTEFCRKNGWYIFMRDYNWLGFPTIRLFVPELECCILDHLLYMPDQVFKLKKMLITNIREIQSIDLGILSRSESLIYVVIKNYNLSTFLGIDTLSLRRISTWEFFSLLCLAYGNSDLFKKFWKLRKSNEILITFKNEPFKDFSKKLLTRLEKLIPNCHQECNNCRHVRTCRYGLLESIEKKITSKYPELFKVIKNHYDHKIQDFFC